MILRHYESNGRKTSRRVANSFAHLIPYFARTAAKDLGVSSPGYVAHRLKQKAAPATIRQELTNLGTALGLAVLAGEIEFKPRLATVRVRNIRNFAVSRERVDDLLAYLPSDIRDLAEAAYLTGWRRSELLTLIWDQVDLKDEVIRLEPGTTKSGCGRIYPYAGFSRLGALIRSRLRKTLDAETRSGIKIAHVFHRRGEPIRTFARSWKAACDRAKLRGYVFHDLRRSAAQNLVRAGVPMQTAMALLGHRTRSIFDRYAIVDEEDLKRGVTRYAERMGSSPPRNRP